MFMTGCCCVPQRCGLAIAYKHKLYLLAVVNAIFALHGSACQHCSSCLAEDIVEHEQDAVEDTTSTGPVTEGGHPVKEAVQEVSIMQA